MWESILTCKYHVQFSAVQITVLVRMHVYAPPSGKEISDYAQFQARYIKTKPNQTKQQKTKPQKREEDLKVTLTSCSPVFICKI